MQSGESTVTGRRPFRKLGLSVVNPDDPSDEDGKSRNLPIIRTNPLPVPIQSSTSLPPQNLGQTPPYPYAARPPYRQPTHPAHSASSSTSSISSTSLAYQSPRTRQLQMQSSPTSRYANGSPFGYVGSSSSSRSSPVIDTTPPPTTPSNNLPPVNFAGGVTDDRNLDGLGLSVVDDNDYPAQAYTQSRPDPRNGLTPYADPSKGVSQTHLAVNTNTVPPADRLIITATADAENHVIVDITGAKDAALIRERIFSKLRIPEDEHSNYNIYRTELGEAALGEPVSDDYLMIYCEAWADSKGTLKFLVQRDGPTPTSYQPPASLPRDNIPQQPPAPSDSSSTTPPLHSPANGRRGEPNMSGGVSSSDRDRDRPPWDRMADGYVADVDGGNRARRRQSPTPIDTNTRGSRRREPSASGSDFSPTSPNGPPHGSVPIISPIINRRPPPQVQNPQPNVYLAPSTPSTHRRRESETAAQEREQALEASERLRETQTKDYDVQYRHLRAERERAARRQHNGQIGEGGTTKSHRSESVDSGSSSAPHGWVLVNEVFPSDPNAGNSKYNLPRSTSFTRSNTDYIGSPPSDSPKFSPGSVGTPQPSRPFPHASSPPYSGQSNQRSATGPSSASSGRYPNPYPHPNKGHGTHQPLPPGAVDPRMRQQVEWERQQAPPSTQALPSPSQFYTPSIPAAYTNPPSAYNGPPSSGSSRMLQPTSQGRSSGQDGGGSLRSPRSLSDLRQVSPTSSGIRSGMNGAPSMQFPLVSSKPTALPQTNLLSDPMYGGNRAPLSPNRLPPPSPSRPILSPSSFYNGGSNNGRNPSEHSGSSNRTPGLFSGGIFADSPLPPPHRLRSKQSYDRLPFDRTMAAHARTEAPPPLPSGPVPQGKPGLPSASSSYRPGWISNTASPGNSRPQSGEADILDTQSRPSPVEGSHNDALRSLEGRRPSVPMLSVANNIDDNAPLTSPYSDVPNSAAMQIPQAVITPSSPVNDMQDPGTGTIRPGQYDLEVRSSDIPTAVSPAISAASSELLSEDGSDGTLRPGQREYLLSHMGSDNDADGETNGSGTLRQRPSQSGPPNPVTKAKRVSIRQGTAKFASISGPEGEQHADGEDQYSDEDSDEDEDDSLYWQTAPVIKEPGNKGEGITMVDKVNRPDPSRPRGPSLVLEISPVVDDRTSPDVTPSTSTLTPSNNSPAGLTPTGGASLNRRASFRRDTWAFRPSTEDVYDRLQDFFPDHDLDKPIIEPMSGPTSGSGSPTTEAPAPEQRAPASKESKFKHRKSIRFVAEERKKALDRINSAKEPSTKAANLARKRSTKLWGSKVEEITPGQERMMIAVPPTIPESPTGTTPEAPPTMKWIKGDLIGKGTYGKVFMAINVTTGEVMAVKQVEMPQTVSDQDDVRQVSIVNALKAEQQTLEALDHVNVVQYLGFEETKEFFSVFLEYVPGGSIGTCLRKHGKFDEQIIKSFTGQMVDGLAYLHSNRIIHRDVKADNVLVDQYGNCKISDFGISKRSDDIYMNAAMTAMQGSLFWMAPEMLHNNKKGYNAKIDIWSLGCVLIEMFAGRRPWEQDDFVSVMFKVGHNKMAPPVPDDVTLSADAEDFRLKCFTQDPEERPTAEALKSHPFLIVRRGWSFTGFH